MEVVRGIIIERPDGQLEVRVEYMTMEEAKMIQEIFEIAGHRVYIGSVVKRMEGKRITAKLLDGAIGVIQ